MTAGLPVTDRTPFAAPDLCILLCSRWRRSCHLVGCGDGGDAQSASAAVQPPNPPPPPSAARTMRRRFPASPCPRVLGERLFVSADGRRRGQQYTDVQRLGSSLRGPRSPRRRAAQRHAAAGDVGTYANIVITVSDGRSTTALARFSVNVVGTATGSATLSWTPPTQNTDGSALTDLAGYRSTGARSRTACQFRHGQQPGSVELRGDQLTPAKWYFATTALNSRVGWRAPVERREQDRALARDSRPRISFRGKTSPGRAYAVYRNGPWGRWWAMLGLNQRPLPCESSALPLS